MKVIDELKNKILSGEQITRQEAESLVQIEELPYLFAGANEIREHFLGNRVVICSIVNAKSGYCPEDCGFCSQSSQFKTPAPSYRMKDIEFLKQSVDIAYQNGATEYSFVTSGKKINNSEELKTLGEVIRYTKENTNMEACTSLGLMTEEELSYLKNHGMDHYHHNLETSRSYFPNIISTHSYDDELDAIRNAKKVGLKTCCGGIFGMGESWDQRLEMAFDLRELDVDSIPINFLNPIEGTALEYLEPLKPLEALKIVSIYRFIFPQKDVMVMGGREKVLGDMQSWIFLAGANGLLLGNYLTTSGRSVEDDLKMLKDLNLEPESHCKTH